MRPFTSLKLLACLVLAGALGCVVPVPYPPHASHPHGGPPGLAHHPHGGPPGQMKKHRGTADALALEHDDPLILVVVSPRLGFNCWRHGDHYHCKR